VLKGSHLLLNLFKDNSSFINSGIGSDIKGLAGYLGVVPAKKVGLYHYHRLLVLMTHHYIIIVVIIIIIIIIVIDIIKIGRS